MQLGESPSVYVQHLLYRMGGRGVCEGEGVCFPILGACGERGTLFYKILRKL